MLNRIFRHTRRATGNAMLLIVHCMGKSVTLARHVIASPANLSQQLRAFFRVIVDNLRQQLLSNTRQAVSIMSTNALLKVKLTRLEALWRRAEAHGVSPRGEVVVHEGLFRGDPPVRVELEHAGDEGEDGGVGVWREDGGEVLRAAHRHGAQHLLRARGAQALDAAQARLAGELGDEGELVVGVVAGEEGLAENHLGEDAAARPEVDGGAVVCGARDKQLWGSVPAL